MIPDEAVEAAAQELFASRGEAEWASRSDVMKDKWRKDLRAALTAAAPFIAAQAWDEGWYAEGWQSNPYRSET